MLFRSMFLILIVEFSVPSKSNKVNQSEDHILSFPHAKAEDSYDHPIGKFEILSWKKGEFKGKSPTVFYRILQATIPPPSPLI